MNRILYWFGHGIGQMIGLVYLFVKKCKDSMEGK